MTHLCSVNVHKIRNIPLTLNQKIAFGAFWTGLNSHQNLCYLIKEHNKSMIKALPFVLVFQYRETPFLDSMGQGRLNMFSVGWNFWLVFVSHTINKAQNLKGTLPFYTMFTRFYLFIFLEDKRAWPSIWLTWQCPIVTTSMEPFPLR